MHEVLRGIGVSPGAVAGPVARLAPPPPDPPAGATVEDPGAEAARAGAALAGVAEFLRARGAAAGGDAEEVLEAQAMMAEDPELHEQVADLVADGRTAARAVHEGLISYAEVLRGMGGYLGERVADIEDIRCRAVALLTGARMPGVPLLRRPSILVARDLAPADTATLDRDQVLGFVTELGGPTSHTAILAKQLGIPAVVACPDVAGLVEGASVVVDGSAGEITVDPPESVLAGIAARAASRAAMPEPSGPGRTADGTPVALLVNVGTVADARAAADVPSEGVGLFRTEVLYLGRATAPPVKDQIEAYRAVFEAFAGRKVVIRTLDAGADKPLPFVGHAHEANPALGVRGLRVARRQPELLTDQLMAIAEAASACSAEVWVMAPMVSTPAEAAEFAGQARAFGLSTVGAMVEVPAAALRATQLLERCDFVSIGTNDLAQYAFAADRTESALADLLDIWQPALLDLVAAVADGGRRTGRPVGVCGEAAGDPLLALVLVGLGLTSLSMAPACLPPVRHALSTHTLDECRGMAKAAREADDAVSARESVRRLASPDLLALI
ncbi:phosphoenolpyruvate--protein phosphotransferase [Pseudonocardia sp. DSM 110487]|uniref:phosphoenolpyruvate--protein phosphotransferase n=1 Tax=Pseudonocardia sp. DSM 110487 TaxID=2865833 RepID=UPI001C6A4498|nr:phosphoenolpyruvate--protein phosphotransferase [Pseudonocardia sp. DSM 110487]QYN39308.1 phosphoenolpyruvate--protein phosphotransferase [Pseudonocardia sp. DSM 110487]